MAFEVWIPRRTAAQLLSAREVATHVKDGIMTALYRICAAHSRVRLLPRGEIELPPQPPRIQRYVVHG